LDEKVRARRGSTNLVQTNAICIEDKREERGRKSVKAEWREEHQATRDAL
jgi:hypothetical protein